jgi:hypothetical protein
VNHVLFSMSVIAAFVFCLEQPAFAAEPKFTPEQLQFFEREVQPILSARCWKCHGADEKVKANLRLISRQGVLKGGDLGSAIDLKKWEDSRLIQAINWKNDLEMPPTGKLPEKEIEVLTRWVKEGAPMPAQITVAKETPKHRGGVVTEEAKKYWAYQPIKRSQTPTVANRDWVKNPIDAFILEKLEAKGLSPAKPADPIALIRRVTYDLTGLPPTPEDVDAFLREYAAKPQAAYEALVDRLLASPHYGEKWGRHWLDLVRYAETNGYERDGLKPYAWRYRDYVIRSFNADKPFDRFIKEQLAGDELDRDDPDCIIATGYYRLGLWDDEPADPKLARYDELDDWVATTSQVFLGMTMNCARCHEHKIDPFPHADYYRLLAFFQDVPRYSNNRDVRSSANMTDIAPLSKRKEYEGEIKAREAEIENLTKQVKAFEDEAIKKMPAEDQRASEGVDRPAVVKKVPQFLDEPRKSEYLKLRKQVESLKKMPSPAQELALSINNCAVRPPESFVLARGNPGSPGNRVEPGFPEVLGVPDPKIPTPNKDARSSGRRLALAKWIASKENVLTPRVIVNRLWQHHFGRGIVPTTNDFGQFGEKPTHPELLDWLASEMINPSQSPSASEGRAWTLKRMHKLIMMSNAYQMSSTASIKGLADDPGNMLFWRFNMRRLTAEEVRDSFLAVSGKLNPKMYGASIYPKIPKEVLAGQSVPGQGWGNSSPEEAARRSIYVHIKRSLLVPILIQHDQADTDSSCPVRYTTTVPTQALGMLNGQFSNEQAEALAERLTKEAPGNVSGQLKRAIRLTTGRNASDDEVKKDAAFIAMMRDKHKLSEGDALKRYCLLALNANEFLYLD